MDITSELFQQLELTMALKGHIQYVLKYTAKVHIIPQATSCWMGEWVLDSVDTSLYSCTLLRRGTADEIVWLSSTIKVRYNMFMEARS